MPSQSSPLILLSVIICAKYAPSTHLVHHAVGDLSFTKEYRLAQRTFRYTLSDDIIPRSNFRYRHVGKHINVGYNGTSVIDNHLLTRYVDEVKALSSSNCMYDDMPTD